MAKLVLIRHGQSIWNLQNRFTGWVDVSLSEKGLKEAKNAGKLLKDYKFDLAFTSTLIRAHETLFEVLKVNEKISNYQVLHDDKSYDKFTPFKNFDKKTLMIKKDSALNERHYGNLQGLNKDETRKKVGEKQVHIWRRSYDVAPPYGESLKDTYNRAVPYFRYKILKEVKQGKNIIVSAHGNSLRAIIKYLEKISNNDIPNLELATGTPIVYNINKEGKITKKEILL